VGVKNLGPPTLARPPGHPWRARLALPASFAEVALATKAEHKGGRGCAVPVLVHRLQQGESSSNLVQQSRQGRVELAVFLVELLITLPFLRPRLERSVQPYQLGCRLLQARIDP